jgi:hypothetical protein
MSSTAHIAGIFSCPIVHKFEIWNLKFDSVAFFLQLTYFLEQQLDVCLSRELIDTFETPTHYIKRRPGTGTWYKDKKDDMEDLLSMLLPEALSLDPVPRVQENINIQYAPPANTYAQQNIQRNTYSAPDIHGYGSMYQQTMIPTPVDRPGNLSEYGRGPPAAGAIPAASAPESPKDNGWAVRHSFTISEWAHM